MPSTLLDASFCSDALDVLDTSSIITINRLCLDITHRQYYGRYQKFPVKLENEQRRDSGVIKQR